MDSTQSPLQMFRVNVFYFGRLFTFVDIMALTGNEAIQIAKESYDPFGIWQTEAYTWKVF